jgi:hypothetical protein
VEFVFIVEFVCVEDELWLCGFAADPGGEFVCAKDFVDDPDCVELFVELFPDALAPVGTVIVLGEFFGVALPFSEVALPSRFTEFLLAEESVAWPSPSFASSDFSAVHGYFAAPDIFDAPGTVDAFPEDGAPDDEFVAPASS